MKTEILDSINTELKELSNPDRARSTMKYFKTGKGEYGEGDLFLGIPVPAIRKVSKKYWKDISLSETEYLLHSKYHEKRLLSLLILVLKFNKPKLYDQKVICKLYLANTEFINNWDLVDSSAHYILGPYLWETGSLDSENKSELLFRLANSDNIWEKRIAIMSTFYFIKKNEFSYTLKISELLLKDSDDLIHKAVGWMLREIGNRNLTVEENFLYKHYKNMPRTMLRYAIEKLDKEKRQQYLKGNI